MLVLLVACTGTKDSGTTCVSEDPCECGVAWTERLGAFQTIQDAVDAAENGESIYLWEGTFSETTYIPHFSSSPDAPVVSFVGAGANRTFLSPPPPEADGHDIVFSASVGADITVSDVTITGGTGDIYNYDDFGHSLAKGAATWLCDASIRFESVIITENRANLGGALSTS